MSANTNSERIRPEMRSICIPDETWSQAIEMSRLTDRSVSWLIRETIKNLYSKIKDDATLFYKSTK
ncbi:MAG: hypothetical protein HY094_00975 [Candidatus Melainabacteria bacterium]|nr:hypothetical protein [Candidatus Melainabacteria bacterium]